MGYRLRKFTDNIASFFISVYLLFLAIYLFRIRKRGDYIRWEKMAKKALSLAENHLSYSSWIRTLWMNNLAEYYRETGNYTKAYELYEHAASILRGINVFHPHLDELLHNMALLQTEMGHYEEAEKNFEYVIRGRPENHPRLSFSKNSLGVVKWYLGKLDEAEQLFLESVKLREKQYGKRDSAYATSLSHLALIYDAKGEYKHALDLAKEAYEIQSQLHDNNPILIAKAANNLGEGYRKIGEYIKALHYYKVTQKIYKEKLGEDHPDNIDLLGNLLICTFALGLNEDSLNLAKSLILKENQTLSQFLSFSTKAQQLAFVKTLGNSGNFLLSLLAQHPNPNELIKLTLELVIYRKSLSIDIFQKEKLYDANYPYLSEQLGKLLEYRRKMANGILNSLSNKYSVGETSRLFSLEWTKIEKENLERSLASVIPEISLQQLLSNSNADKVANALPTDAALIEIIRFDMFNFKANQAEGEKPWGKPYYLAFVLHAGEGDTVHMIHLGEAKEIDQLISHYRKSILTSQEDHNQLGKKLRQKIFEPILEHLQNKKRLFIAPDSFISFLPFEILPLEGGTQFLIDEYIISYLSTGQDLLRFDVNLASEPTAPIVIADPAYGKLNSDTKLGFSPLKHARLEGQEIGRLLGIRPYVGEEANKITLTQSKSPFILHLSTHGSFFPKLRTFFAGLGRLNGVIQSENPLLRSGLAFAGINEWMHEEDYPEDKDNGFLTAEEVTGLDLVGTELVVLSACESGLGEPGAWEGVFGLRRAFIIAGAKTVVASLWGVDDKLTKDLMVDFYKRILYTKNDLARALHNAQLEIKKKYPHPIIWGAFILQGNPGHLSNKYLPPRQVTIPTLEEFLQAINESNISDVEPELIIELIENDQILPLVLNHLFDYFSRQISYNQVEIILNGQFQGYLHRESMGDFPLLGTRNFGSSQVSNLPGQPQFELIQLICLDPECKGRRVVFHFREEQPPICQKCKKHSMRIFDES